ncbi:unnamed protein product, partial [Symbiodinium sp. KB8]
VQQTERIILPGKPGESDEIFHITRGKIPAELKPRLSQPFTEEEKERIYSQVGLVRAEHVPESARPKALWIFGPPAAGKSTLAAEAAAERFGQAMNAVSVDGNEIRDAHDGFRRVAEHGFDHHVLHKDAWDALKETGCVEGLKKSILKKAIANRQNIVLPDCALKPERVKDMLKSLQDAGYEMHAICLWAPQEEAERRGRLRSVKTGKAYNPKFHQPSCEGTLEVIAHWENQMSLPNGGSFGSIEFYDAGSAPAIRVGKDHFEMLIRCAERGRRRSLCRPEEGRRSSVSEKSKELALMNDAAWVKQASEGDHAIEELIAIPWPEKDHSIGIRFVCVLCCRLAKQERYFKRNKCQGMPAFAKYREAWLRELRPWLDDEGPRGKAARLAKAKIGIAEPAAVPDLPQGLFGGPFYCATSTCRPPSCLSYIAELGEEAVLMGDFNLVEAEYPISDALASGFLRAANEASHGDAGAPPTFQGLSGYTRCLDYALHTGRLVFDYKHQVAGLADHDLVFYDMQLPVAPLPQRFRLQPPRPLQAEAVTTQLWHDVWSQHEASFRGYLQRGAIDDAWALLSNEGERERPPSC